MKKSSDGLLPCPFCGSNNISFGKKFVGCENCGAQTGYIDNYPDEGALANAWNTRAETAQLIELRNQCEVLDKLNKDACSDVARLAASNIHCYDVITVWIEKYHTLTQALKFYADRDSYKFTERFDVSPINDDRGHKARVALDVTKIGELAQQALANTRTDTGARHIPALVAAIKNCEYHASILRDVMKGGFSRQEALLMLENLFTAIGEAGASLPNELKEVG